MKTAGKSLRGRITDLLVIACVLVVGDYVFHWSYGPVGIVVVLLLVFVIQLAIDILRGRKGNFSN